MGPFSQDSGINIYCVSALSLHIESTDSMISINQNLLCPLHMQPDLARHVRLMKLQKSTHKSHGTHISYLWVAYIESNKRILDL